MLVLQAADVQKQIDDVLQAEAKSVTQAIFIHSS